MRDHGVSPFLGMNPYLEGPVNWSDFHATFIGAVREELNRRLPEPYYARVGELVMTVTPDDPLHRRVREPDVFVGRNPAGPSARFSTVGDGPAVALLEPVTLAHPQQDDPHTELYIDVVRMPDREVVTVVELFSPTNKYGDGRAAYADKRRQLLQSSANVVELDLLRAGRRLPLTRPLPPDDYYCFVSRGDRRPACDVYHWSVRDPLPALPIPLRSPDADVVVGLADPFRVAFARGEYGRFIDYAEPPPAPAFDADTAAWLRGQAGPDRG